MTDQELAAIVETVLAGEQVVFCVMCGDLKTDLWQFFAICGESCYKEFDTRHLGDWDFDMYSGERLDRSRTS